MPEKTRYPPGAHGSIRDYGFRVRILESYLCQPYEVRPRLPEENSGEMWLQYEGFLETANQKPRGCEDRAEYRVFREDYCTVIPVKKRITGNRPGSELFSPGHFPWEAGPHWSLIYDYQPVAGLIPASKAQDL